MGERARRWAVPAFQVRHKKSTFNQLADCTLNRFKMSSAFALQTLFQVPYGGTGLVWQSFGGVIMRHTGGGSWVCLALLGLVACSSAALPPAEGSASMTIACNQTFTGNINGPGGESNIADNYIGQTVLSGRDGYSVTCTVQGNSISGDIESPGSSTILLVDGSAAQGSTLKMWFYTTGMLNELSSSACTLTTIKALSAGSIWAAYSCTSVSNPSDLTTAPCTASGEFVFTGCGTS